MPSQVLVRKEPLTSKEWQGLIVTQQERLRPYLNQITLSKLDDLQIQWGEPALGNGLWYLDGHCPVFTSKDPKLVSQGKELQGIFGLNSYSKVSSSSIRIYDRYFWGITRRNRWLLGKMGLSRFQQIWTCESIEINYHPLEKVLEYCQPDDVLERIGEVIGEMQGILEIRVKDFAAMAMLVQDDVNIACNLMGK